MCGNYEIPGATLTEVNGARVIAHYGDPVAEHAARGHCAGILYLNFRGRLCLTGADRIRFLHGQVTNDVKRLQAGEGCYAALVSAKGRIQSDLNLYCLPDEVLLDFEPGLAQAVSQRLANYIVADDVQLVDVAPEYGLLSAQGPNAKCVITTVLSALSSAGIPAAPFSFVQLTDPLLGDIYVVNQPRLSTSGFDLFVPAAAMPTLAAKLIETAKSSGGAPCGWQSLEMARIEAGIPRYGVDMDETNIALECGIETRAVSFSKGCYVGQEVLNRIHTLGHVNKELCGLRLADGLETMPVKGDKLFHAAKEVGFVTSALASPAFKSKIALGYVRRETSQVGTALFLHSAGAQTPARIVQLPFSDQSLQLPSS